MRGLWAKRLAATMLGAGLLVASGPVRADVVDPATAPTIRSLTYNVCGGYAPCRSGLDTAAWTAALKQQVDAWDTDVVMLQELCIGQWIALRGAMPNYRGVWTSTVQSAQGCAKWDVNGDSRFGLGVFVRASSVERFTAELTVPAGTERRAVLCAKGPVDGRTTLACTTHLAQYITPDNGSSQVMAHLDRWAEGLPVIIGADVNERPNSPALDPIRAGSPAMGGFAEVDENDRDYFDQSCIDSGARECHSGEPTVVINGVPAKFDDIFLTADDFHTVRGDAIDPGLSDHQLLRGAAYAE